MSRHFLTFAAAMDEKKVTGVVGAGKALGREIGYPTANIYGVEGLGAADGVYAVKAKVEGVEETLFGMGNLGRRPTVDRSGENRVLEVHFFDYEGDLYGRSVEVALCRYIRPEITFGTVDELQSRIGQDEVEVRKYFETQ
ncbi:MAG: riboflavin kinase [Rikenellaceae bacterium]|nr:riboflavin kinase [Rikenellaceae bacterium]